MKTLQLIVIAFAIFFTFITIHADAQTLFDKAIQVAQLEQHYARSVKSDAVVVDDVNRMITTINDSLLGGQALVISPIFSVIYDVGVQYTEQMYVQITGSGFLNGCPNDYLYLTITLDPKKKDEYIFGFMTKGEQVFISGGNVFGEDNLVIKDAHLKRFTGEFSDLDLVLEITARTSVWKHLSAVVIDPIVHEVLSGAVEDEDIAN